MEKHFSTLPTVAFSTAPVAPCQHATPSRAPLSASRFAVPPGVLNLPPLTSFVARGRVRLQQEELKAEAEGWSVLKVQAEGRNVLTSCRRERAESVGEAGAR